jgi:hypothetical protein
MCLHDHSNDFRKLFSVTDHGQTIAVMKPSAQLPGWWVLEGRGIEWVNPLARDISEVRKQARKDEWPDDATSSLYNKSARYMLIKGKQAALNEMRSLARQCGEVEA